MRWKRLFYYLVLNMIITACTMIAVLYAWERYRPQVVDSPLDLLFATSGPAVSVILTEVPGDAGERPVESAPGETGFEQYTVQSGDSLSAIAETFDTTVEDILAYNDLENPDALVVGTVLTIPVEGGTGLPPTPVPVVPTTAPPPVPTLSADSAPEDFGDPELQVSLVIGAGDLEEERVVVRQAGDAQVSLQGWQIRSPQGDVYTFPQLMLFKDGAVTVYTRAGGNSVAVLYWGLDRAIWSAGDVVSLIDPQGNIVAAYQVP